MLTGSLTICRCCYVISSSEMLTLCVSVWSQHTYQQKLLGGPNYCHNIVATVSTLAWCCANDLAFSWSPSITAVVWVQTPAPLVLWYSFRKVTAWLLVTDFGQACVLHHNIFPDLGINVCVCAWERECIHVKVLLLLVVEHFHGCVPHSLLLCPTSGVSVTLIWFTAVTQHQIGCYILRMKIPNSFPGSVSCNYQNRIYLSLKYRHNRLTGQRR